MIAWVVIGLIALAVTLLVDSADKEDAPYDSWEWDRSYNRYSWGLPYSEAGRRAR